MTIHWKAVEQYFTVVLFVNPLTPKVKPWVTQSFLTFDSMDRTIHCKAVGQYFTVMLFVFQFYRVWNFGIFISFGLGTVRNESVKVRDGAVIFPPKADSSVKSSIDSGSLKRTNSTLKENPQKKIAEGKEDKNDVSGLVLCYRATFTLLHFE